MALPSRELANRKLLEELELNKKLLKQGAVPVLSNLNQPNTPSSTFNPEMQSLSSTQRSALNLAHTQSYGYYIPQDSSFGNLILPVLPRFDKK